jgi:glycosyltransferase involved in cell wall biosynthesis
VWQLATSLLDAGARVTIATLDSHVHEAVTLDGPRLVVHFGHFRPRARRHMSDLMAVERNAVRRSLEHANPDIVHAHWTYEYALGSLASRLPTLVTVRDWAPTILRLSPDAYRLGRLAMFEWCLARARHLTAVSPYIQTHLERVTCRPVAVVPNGVPDRFFSRRHARLDPQAPVLVSVNNGFGRGKNVTALLEAFAVVRRSLPATRLTLAGEGFARAGEAESWAIRRGCADGVTFLGPIGHDEVLSLLGSSGVLVHPSLEESFGMTLIEAMSQRVPVIGGTRCGALGTRLRSFWRLGRRP